MISVVTSSSPSISTVKLSKVSLVPSYFSITYPSKLSVTVAFKAGYSVTVPISIFCINLGVVSGIRFVFV